MPGLVRFVPNQKNIQALARSPQMVAYLGARAEKAADAARSIAPVMTGAYKGSIEGQAGFGGRVGVARGRLNAHDFKAGWIEFGTYKWPAHATLRRACEAVGLKVSARRERA